MQSFPEIRRRGFVYVDKSQYIEKLFDYGKYFFPGRPRRFGKLRIFSDINNINDISMMPEFAGICGITSEELHQYFDSGVKALASKHERSTEQVYADLKANYDGYHFSEECYPDV